MHHPIDSPDLEAALDRAADLLRRAARVAALTGAGVSAESGVATFRGAGGLWEGHAVTEVATPEAFDANPALVWRFYNQRRAGLLNVRPNAGHATLAAMEQRWGRERFTLCTQNIDGLHHAAGSTRVLELHGRLSRVRCTACDYVADRPGEDLPDLPACPQCGKLLRPDIVWFGETLPPRVWNEAEQESRRCDCFLVVGTSAIVYPAAGLILSARARGATVIEVNLERTSASSEATESLFGPSGQVLPELMKRLA